MNEELRERRGLILHALHANYPNPVTRGAIDRQVMPFYTSVKELDRDIEYLADKGFLEKRETEIGERKIRNYEITPAGVDLVDGSTQDPGVHFARA